jgi:ADP-ribose pyrophosphatase
MDNLPSDPAILLSFLNMKLRDEFDSPEALVKGLDLDEDEFIDVKAVELEELVQMIYDGKIEDSKTVSAIMTYKSFLADGRL